MAEIPYPIYENTIVPGLHQIQHKHGYLEPEEMKRFSVESGIPLHRLHEVASFFPHFRFTKPPKVTVTVCRDMACRMAGSGKMLKDLAKLVGPDMAVEGVSCQGRCDRAPAVCFTMAKAEGHGASSEEEAQTGAARGEPPLAMTTSQPGAANRTTAGGRISTPNASATGEKTMARINPQMTMTNLGKKSDGGAGAVNMTMSRMNPQLSMAGASGRSTVSLGGSLNASQAALAAAAAAAKAHEHAQTEFYYLGRPVEEIEAIARLCLAGQPPPSDKDAGLAYKAADWTIDPYRGQPSSYAAAIKIAQLRDESLKKAMEKLQSERSWSHDKAEQFRRAARRRLWIDEDLDDQVLEAVLAWQTNQDWAQGPDLGNWSDTYFAEIDKAKANLRGLGGASQSATQKWKDVRESIRRARKRGADDRGFIVVNGDESEPSTFKDRELLLRSPHLIVEGVILAGMVTEASQGFIYIRHEYPEQIRACELEIARAEKLGVCGMVASVLGRPFPISVFPSPGGYICGEQSALIEAMSDRRGEPRNMPPMLETNGLDDRPTLVSNVETYAWTPYIWLQGGDTYASLGVNSHKGRRFFSVCGDVERPGVYEVPMGIRLRDLLYGSEYCRGIKGNKKLKAFAPSGPSGGFLPNIVTAEAMTRMLNWGGMTARDFPPGIITLPPDQREKHFSGATLRAVAARRGFSPDTTEIDILDLELEVDVWRALAPTMALGAGLCVYSEERDMMVEAVNSIQFYRNESCGKCVPCRIGSQKLANMGAAVLDGKVERSRWGDELLPMVRDLDEAIIQTSICGLGRSVPLPYRTVLNFFPEDVARHIKGGV